MNINWNAIGNAGLCLVGTGLTAIGISEVIKANARAKMMDKLSAEMVEGLKTLNKIAKNKIAKENLGAGSAE